MIALALLAAMALLLSACDGPAAPSPPALPVLQGIVRGGELARGLKVVVPGTPPHSAVVEKDGTFSMGGLPEKRFTAEFVRGTAVVGRQAFADVRSDHQITVTVEVTPNELLLLDERRLRLGDKDVEVQGRVRKILAQDEGGDSQVEIDLWVAIARAGVTKIIRGEELLGVDDLTVGRRVRVTGEWNEGSMVDVLATTIEVLSDDDPQGRAAVCHRPDAKASPRTLVIGTGALAAHEAHGDPVGACPE